MPSIPSTQPQAASVPTQFYTWQGYRCAYDKHMDQADPNLPPLVLIHPIGVGLSRRFWDRFIRAWFAAGHRNPIYNPDLLGCGDSDKPHVAYTPDDWAAHLQHFLQTVVQRPAIALSQGALLPVTLRMAQQQAHPSRVKAMVLAGPPAWAIMTEPAPQWQQKLLWNLFDSPLGSAFYRYARRRNFLQSFSIRQLFDQAGDVDSEWLDTLQQGADDPATRHAVFSFLAGFWRTDYTEAIAHLPQPTLVVLGKTASSIGRSGKAETPDERMHHYLSHLLQGKGETTAGRNVLPYEAPQEFVAAIAPFIADQSAR